MIKTFIIAIHSKKSLVSSHTRKSYLLKNVKISKNNIIQKFDIIDYYRHEKNRLIDNRFFGV
jgi:hypothetical protein